MAMNEQEIVNGIRQGTLSLEELGTALGSTSNANNVNVTNWEAVYSDTTGQLSIYCTATATNGSAPITGIGVLAYSANGAQMYALQYNNGLADVEIMASIGTSLFTPSMGNQVLSVVYGWTTQGSFYLTKTLTIQPG